ncbi:hypothetical protein PRIPAC_80471 [Pristionchus pacificus]|uniref:Uncharacterized protein n=1 Tax=Pristionchus pacificus TaxID=54126 RepID=A0A2A6C4R7_PRIPA|nr:hypothetical protein PRIPAC_80471 [Pristionchus pacificus]|eukprot:PDM73120.1 hypothetical protein PRIPAC_39554 [Pristionchus pacificus]
MLTNLNTRRKMSQILDSSLKVKYQIRETFEIGMVMMHCGAISLVMKIYLTVNSRCDVILRLVSLIIHVLDLCVRLFRPCNCLSACRIWKLRNVFYSCENRFLELQTQLHILFMRDDSVRLFNSSIDDADMYFNDLKRAWE